MKIFVAGHRGMVGSAIVRRLTVTTDCEIVVRERSQLDLTDQAGVLRFFLDEKPDAVYLAAAKVGGVYSNNTYPADFIYQNLAIQINVIHSAHIAGVRKLLFLGSSCVYPRLAEQPMPEEVLLTGKLEPTNEPYAVAKIAGIKMCESYNRQHGESYGTDYRSVMPTNLYGPGDNYHEQNSHVIPAMIRRFHSAKEQRLEAVCVWGSGAPKREFLYVDDMAEASIHVMNLPFDEYRTITSPMQGHVNVGSGEEMTISELARTVADIIDYPGRIEFDHSMPDGAPRKLLDSHRLFETGWKPRTQLVDGLHKAYKDYLQKRLG